MSLKDFFKVHTLIIKIFEYGNLKSRKMIIYFLQILRHLIDQIFNKLCNG